MVHSPLRSFWDLRVRTCLREFLEDQMLSKMMGFSAFDSSQGRDHSQALSAAVEAVACLSAWL